MRRTWRNRIKITELNANLVCVLCGGYYIDATTIIECLHSFCKSCIVRYLEANKYCPICDVQVHKTRPLQNIRSDATLQHLVYKLVPGLYQNEMLRRRQFYSVHTDSKPELPEQRGEIKNDSIFYSPDEYVKISLQYHSTFDGEGSCADLQPVKRYLRCPAAVTVRHLQKLIRAKFGLREEHIVEILYLNEPLDEDFTLMDVAYIHNWCRKGLMNLRYRIFESCAKRLKIDYGLQVEKEDSKELDLVCDDEQNGTKDNLQNKDAECEFSSFSQPPNNLVECEDTSNGDVLQKSDVSSWKEVQIQISESGVMSITDITSGNQELSLENIVSTLKTSDDVLVNSVEVFFSESYGPVVNGSGDTNNQSDKNLLCKRVPDNSGSSEIGSLVDTTFATSNLLLPGLAEPQYLQKTLDLKEDVSDRKEVTKFCDSPVITDNKKSDAGVGLVSLPESHSSLDYNYSIDNSVYQAVPHSESFHTHCLLQKDTYSKQEKSIKDQILKGHEKQNFATPTVMCSSRRSTYANSPVGYKTLKTPPKSWNPSLSRLSYLSSKTNSLFQERSDPIKKTDSMNATSPDVLQSSQCSDKLLKEVGGSNNTTVAKPPRFFKMRNMPRFLGNPASGVKRMFQVVSPGGQKNDGMRTPYLSQLPTKQNNIQLVKLNSKPPSQPFTGKNGSPPFTLSPSTRTHVDSNKFVMPGFSTYQKNLLQYSEFQNVSPRSGIGSKNISPSGTTDKQISSVSVPCASESVPTSMSLSKTQNSHISPNAVQLLYGNLPPVSAPVATVSSLIQLNDDFHMQSPPLKHYSPLSSPVDTFVNPRHQQRQGVSTSIEKEQQNPALHGQTLAGTVALEGPPETEQQQNINKDLSIAHNNSNDSNSCRTVPASDQHKLSVSRIIGTVQPKFSPQSSSSEDDKQAAKVNTDSTRTAQNCAVCVIEETYVPQVSNSTTVTAGSADTINYPGLTGKLPVSESSCTDSNSETNLKGRCDSDHITLDLQCEQPQNSDTSCSGLSSGLCDGGLKGTEKPVEVLTTNNNTEFFNKETYVHCGEKEIIPSV
ncbi:uncharacterized protein LOC126469942 [Schistocerca serialis cubense]|uniref:uncharacterized protein LOC126469942 n=1 Tax=Schistocerca serialis cubense TaxID=2023355 RepID=UPI00214EFB0A|nr:uncharacterized protein LOC126469942 [Schistocerca serialis cubense]